jgi:hypothetical protein
MSTSPIAPLLTTAAAGFGSIYGYRFNGDSVELHATFRLLNESAHQLRWKLQLHASAASDPVAKPLVTHLIAEAQLPPLAETAGASEPFYLTATAALPAGNREFNLTLMLVAERSSQPDEVHDVAVFARPERFALPRFAGEIGHTFGTDHVHLSVAAIENPRDPENLTGTLSLELWALPEPYAGGGFQGTPLASVRLGHLSGQQSWNSLSYELGFTPPPAGLGHLTLMLREWTGAGYTTRDYTNFTTAYPLESVARAEPALIVNSAAPAPETKTLAIPQAPLAQKTAASEVPVKATGAAATKATAKKTPATAPKKSGSPSAGPKHRAKKSPK